MNLPFKNVEMDAAVDAAKRFAITLETSSCRAIRRSY
jgi:hypothetical protein